MSNSILITSEEVDEIKKATRGIVCKNVCNGTGVLIEKTKRGVTYNDCVCTKEFLWQVKLVQARIPRKHWDFTLRNLLKKFIKENNQSLALIDGYVKQIDTMIKEGVGLYIQGMHGLAKTAMASYVLKEFLKADKAVFFIRMSSLTHLIFESLRDEIAKEKVKWIKKDTQALVIDEIEKDYKIDNETSFSGSRVGEIFDDIYEAKKCLIVTSNVPKKDLSFAHSRSVSDRMQELVDIPLVGQSYRGTVDKKSIILKGIQKKNE